MRNNPILKLYTFEEKALEVDQLTSEVYCRETSLQRSPSPVCFFELETNVVTMRTAAIIAVVCLALAFSPARGRSLRKYSFTYKFMNPSLDLLKTYIYCYSLHGIPFASDKWLA
jgi:hypothetical protein